jgi:hypothetical protein
MGEYTAGLLRAAELAEMWARRCADDRLPREQRAAEALARTFRAEAETDRYTTHRVQIWVCSECGKKREE